MMNCSAVEKVRSQFFQSLRCFSSHAKLLSTTHRLGITANVCNSLRLTTDTSICFPKRAFTPSVNGFQFWKNFRRNTSYKSTFLGAVFLRPISNIERSCSICSFVMSLGYFFFILFYSIFLRV